MFIYAKKSSYTYRAFCRILLYLSNNCTIYVNKHLFYDSSGFNLLILCNIELFEENIWTWEGRGNGGMEEIA